MYTSQISIYSNKAANGGGVYAYTSQLYFDVMRITDNMASQEGGGLYTENCETYLQPEGEVSRNTAGSDGGGVWSYMGGTNATNITFAGNRAKANGGGFFGTQVTLWTVNTHWEGNYAGQDGGGLRMSGSTLMMNRTESVNQHAGGKGGGMSLFDCTNILWNVSFVLNFAQEGGAASVEEGKLSFCFYFLSILFFLFPLFCSLHFVLILFTIRNEYPLEFDCCGMYGHLWEGRCFFGEREHLDHLQHLS